MVLYLFAVFGSYCFIYNDFFGYCVWVTVIGIHCIYPNGLFQTNWTVIGCLTLTVFYYRL